MRNPTKSVDAGRPIPPTVNEVLDCLASDCSGYENERDFESWAEELGYDTDSRKAESVYNTIGQQCRDLKKLLGNELYNELLFETERQ